MYRTCTCVELGRVIALAPLRTVRVRRCSANCCQREVMSLTRDAGIWQRIAADFINRRESMTHSVIQVEHTILKHESIEFL